jgi:xanthine dehydrogenase YagS FAD-binding subunit
MRRTFIGCNLHHRMDTFQYVRAEDGEAAVAALGSPGAVPLGGGTDLVPLWREGLVHPAVVVDVRSAEPGDDVAIVADGSVSLRAGARLASLASHPLLVADLGVLAQACGDVGAPALRAQGTLGGNLCQRPRCWYWRAGHSCAKSGGSGCPAAEGEHRYHAIVEAGPCWAVHPSDPAVALTALDATVHLRGPGGTRAVPIADFFVLPAQDVTRETVVAPGEYVTHCTIPAASRGGTQWWTKTIQRGAWDFALVSCAAVRRRDGDVRLVLGGVGPRPWRVNSSIEEDVASGGLDADSMDALAERAMYDASPLPGTAYKVTMAQTLLVRAMHALAATGA